MKIRGVLARKGDTPEYIRGMQQELFEVLGQARSREEVQEVEPRAREIAKRYRNRLVEAEVWELAIHRRVSRLRYSRQCVEASAVQAHLRQGIPLAPGMEICYVVRDANKWEADPERTARKFDVGYYGKLLEKAWEEEPFVFRDGSILPGERRKSADSIV